MMKPGTYKARGVAALLGNSSEKGTPQIDIQFRIVEGEFEGELIRWTGYFTEKTSERTIESLQICGWQGDDLSVFAQRDDGTIPPPNGVDRNPVELVLEEEVYEGKTRVKVKWVNRPGGGRELNLENAMTRQSASSFAESMKGIIHATRMKKAAAQGTNVTDFPHGANAPAPQQAAAGQKKAW